jgi:hypothetical protein
MINNINHKPSVNDGVADVNATPRVGATTPVNPNAPANTATPHAAQAAQIAQGVGPAIPNKLPIQGNVTPGAASSIGQPVPNQDTGRNEIRTSQAGLNPQVDQNETASTGTNLPPKAGQGVGATQTNRGPVPPAGSVNGAHDGRVASAAVNSVELFIPAGFRGAHSAKYATVLLGQALDQMQDATTTTGLNRIRDADSQQDRATNDKMASQQKADAENSASKDSLLSDIGGKVLEIVAVVLAFTGAGAVVGCLLLALIILKDKNDDEQKKTGHSLIGEACKKCGMSEEAGDKYGGLVLTVAIMVISIVTSGGLAGGAKVAVTLIQGAAGAAAAEGHRETSNHKSEALQAEAQGTGDQAQMDLLSANTDKVIKQVVDGGNMVADMRATLSKMMREQGDLKVNFA